ncbi:MAG: hypothetical protein M1827_006712 [Pycnora praestabilis]|nr:MAG: hypothetical protein M1827_006712 [Pycnora praestabilis]
MSTEFITFLAPPGESITGYDRTAPSTSQASPVPETFKEAMSIREEVFVHEQHVPLENEFDADDSRSFHWIVYASVSNAQGGSPNSGAEDRKNSATNRMPVGTIRLVPPPHPPHPKPGTTHAIDNAEAEGPDADETMSKTSFHDGKEPYIKLGRLATLPAYRGLGLGRLLVNGALDWASKNPQAILPLRSPTSREAARVESGSSEAQEQWHGLVLLHAQKSVQGMWGKYGFDTDGSMGVWDEEGIDHVGMWKRIQVKEV